MIAKTLSQVALDFCGITDIHQDVSSLNCVYYEYDYLMEHYLASICNDFMVKFPMRAGPFVRHVLANEGGWRCRVFDRRCIAYGGQFLGWDIMDQA